MNNKIYTCSICNDAIPEGRVNLGHTQRCVKHSDAIPYMGFSFSSSKDTREVQIIRNPKTAERLHQLSVTKGRTPHKN